MHKKRVTKVTRHGHATCIALKSHALKSRKTTKDSNPHSGFLGGRLLPFPLCYTLRSCSTPARGGPPSPEVTDPPGHFSYGGFSCQRYSVTELPLFKGPNVQL